MHAIRYQRFGEPADVLGLFEVPEPTITAAGQVLIHVLVRPIHPGDLLGVRGRYRGPGVTSDDVPGGATPGFEGFGVIAQLSEGAQDSDLEPGQRVAFFPGRGAWGKLAVVASEFVLPIPDDVSDAAASQLHVVPLTACMLIRAAEEAGASPDGGTVVLSAAGSAVARLVTVLALRRGWKVINLVRSDAGLTALAGVGAGVTVMSTAETGWQQQLTATAASGIQVALDCVGGSVASSLVSMLSSGGTMISYGDLSNEPMSLKALQFSTRDHRIRGVSVGNWAGLPEMQRRRDLMVALDLVRTVPQHFKPAAEYQMADIKQAVTHAERANKDGAVLLTSH